jgi:hypothetical protein
VRYLRGLPGRCTSATAWSRPPSRYAPPACARSSCVRRPALA